MQKPFLRLAVLSLLITAAVGLPSYGKRQHVHAPLPVTLMDAKTVYIDNQTGSAKLADRAYDELSKWGRFRVVDSPKGADVIFLLSAKEYQSGSVTSGRVDDYGNINASTSRNINASTSQVVTGVTFLTVIDPKGGTSLWSDSKRWGNLYTGFRSATRGLIKALRDRIEEQEAPSTRK
jgi:hypothetical protein